MRKSLDEIRNSFAGRKKANEKQTPLCYYVVRPLSFYLTWLILPLGVSANQVSIFSFLIGLSGCISLSFGYDVGVYVGSILILIVWLLDHIDGNIARTTKTASSYGAFLDSALGTIVYFAFSFSLGIALYNTPDDKLQSMLRFLFKTKTELRPELFLFLGMANASFILLKEFFSKVLKIEDDVLVTKISCGVEHHINLKKIKESLKDFLRKYDVNRKDKKS